MNHQEAILILQAYRPGGQDASDAMFVEALDWVGGKPRLQGWFAEECAFDLHIQTKLREAIPIPSGLKSNLLNLRKTAWLTPGRGQSNWLNAFL